MANFVYNFTVTGDCTNSNTGAININVSGGIPPYTFDWVNPNIGTGDTKTGLGAGVYIVRVNDSLGDINNEFYINIIVSSGGCLNAEVISGTTCGLDNGIVSLSATTNAYPITIKLFSGETELLSGLTFNGELVFSNAPAGVLRAYYEDYGGCSGFSESIIVGDSTPLDWGFYIANNTSCFGDTGRVQITGLTGTPPFTYLWSNGDTGTTITGLTADTYSVTITDFYGCTDTKSAIVGTADPLEIILLSATTPTCFTTDGTVTVKITGGTAPYFYSGSNGTTLISYANEATFSGFGPGTATFQVTDATLCKTLSYVYLQAPASFSVVNLIVKNSTCSTTGGNVTVNLLGDGPFTYTLVYPDSSTNVITQVSPTIVYDNLVNGEYTLVITNGSGCEYEHTFNVFTVDKFSATTQVTGTTCGLNNGLCYVEVGTGYTGVLDFILKTNDVAVIQYVDVAFSSVTFANLSAGMYTLEIRDSDNCSIYNYFTIESSNEVDYILIPTNCGPNNNQGSITTTIFNGTPPFSYQWSANAGNATTQNVSGLSGGTYTLTIKDSLGCTETKSVRVPCTPLVSGYVYLPIISSGFTVTVDTERDFSSMAYEGFYDLTSGNTNCILSTAIYTAYIEISGNTYEQQFFTGTTLNDVPSESQWIQSLENILSGIPGVGSYTFDTVNNKVVVKSSCDGTEDELSDSEFIIGLTIDYDIYCET